MSRVPSEWSRSTTTFGELSSCSALTSFAGDLDAAALEAVNNAIPVWDDGKEFDRFAVRHAALGYIVRDVSPYPEGFDWDRVKVVEESLSRRGIHLLGIQVSDGERFAL